MYNEYFVHNYTPTSRDACLVWGVVSAGVVDFNVAAAVGVWLIVASFNDILCG